MQLARAQQTFLNMHKIPDAALGLGDVSGKEAAVPLHLREGQSSQEATHHSETEAKRSKPSTARSMTLARPVGAGGGSCRLLENKGTRGRGRIWGCRRNVPSRSQSIMHCRCFRVAERLGSCKAMLRGLNLAL